MSFYEDIAGEYDSIVGAASRAEAAGRFVDWLVAKHRPRRAVEVACGTGLYARALAACGLSVVATDVSPAMLEQARAIPVAGPRRIEWVQATMQDVADRVSGPFDALLCMGNSLPHLLTDADLATAAKGFARLLSPGGVAVIQLLNYHRVLARGERFVGASRQGDREYIRFYDFLGELLRFNILELEWAAAGADPASRFHQTTLRPWRTEQVADALRGGGFAWVELFGGLDRSAFDPQESDTVLMIATRGDREIA